MEAGFGTAPAVPAVPAAVFAVPALPTVPAAVSAVPAEPARVPAVPAVPSEPSGVPEVPAVPSEPAGVPAVPAVPAIPAAPDEEYMQFFRSLGIGDSGQVAFLARLLETFHEVAMKLDEHLAPTGAILHATISSMCEGDNHMDAPQHRWIRIVDRIGFFSDDDEHASRVINLGLSFAYRQKELDAAAKAIALRLERTRAAVGRDRSEGATLGQDHSSAAALAHGDVSGCDEVPAGGLVVRNDGASGRSRPKETGDGDGAAHLSDDDGLDVPLGGAVVRRDVAGQPGSDGNGELPKGGVLVVARRDPPGGAAFTRAATAAAAAVADTAAGAVATASPAAADEARASALVKVVGRQSFESSPTGARCPHWPSASAVPD
ncbi:hypothetical protein BU14_0014s0100 [Porphyra umbilicalis]|uniref:Uncharacterized protein n=1 Tax=Porphyra umbilicalis TaxID=2786 RepID=A0A1X6PL22_PORUM|nr:hypothetical protein BU14_0014s0100 [Porphyra umbilicalis]|eukprot:OSX81551.1 hypothetical protein BU14_0014s0100 [Porphyra umbilicalis]